MRQSLPLGAVLGLPEGLWVAAAVVTVPVEVPPRRPLQQRRQGCLATASDTQAVSARELGVLGGSSSTTSPSTRRRARRRRRRPHQQQGAYHGAPVPAPGVRGCGHLRRCGCEWCCGLAARRIACRCRRGGSAARRCPYSDLAYGGVQLLSSAAAGDGGPGRRAGGGGGAAAAAAATPA
jgi:hypothetical protein